MTNHARSDTLMVAGFLVLERGNGNAPGTHPHQERTVDP